MARRSAEDNRRHILQTAGDLFYSNGVRAVGMDRIIKEGGIANATLYRQFATKDELVTAYLVGRNEHWWERLHAATEDKPDARTRILALFEMTDADMDQPQYRGCATLNIVTEFPAPAHPAHQAAVSHKKEVLDWLREQVKETGALRPDELADELMIILDGAQVLAAALGAKGPSQRMSKLVERLLPQEG